jgi:hypothetical protein
MKKGCLIVILILGGLLAGLTTASALEGRMADEFAYLSGQARQSMALSAVELEALVERCDRLLTRTGSLKSSEKKIIGKKLTRLRGLFLYVLESKRAAEGAGDAN